MAHSLVNENYSPKPVPFSLNKRLFTKTHQQFLLYMNSAYMINFLPSFK